MLWHFFTDLTMIVNWIVGFCWCKSLGFWSDAGSCSRGQGSFAGLLCCLCVCENPHVKRVQLWWNHIPTHFFPEEGMDSILIEKSNKNSFNWLIWHVNRDSFWIPQVGDASVGWALGYMLTLSNLLPAEVPTTKKCLSLEVWGILLFILVFLLVAALLFTMITVCFIKKTGKPVRHRSVDYCEPSTISENLWMVVNTVV